MKPHDHIAHYRIDAEEFDYFEQLSGPDLDAAQRIRDGVLHAARIAPGDLVCDAGSGNGWLAGAVPQARVVCTDLGVRNLQRIRAERSGAMAVCADLAHLPFRDGAFRHVVCSEVLEHVPEPQAVIHEFSRILMRGGRLTVSTPYCEKLRYSLCIHCNKPTPVNAHLHSFDEQSHVGLFRSAGLDNPSWSRIQNKLFVASRGSFFCRRLPYTIWRMIDRFCMFVVRKANSIIVSGTRL